MDACETGNMDRKENLGESDELWLSTAKKWADKSDVLGSLI